MKSDILQQLGYSADIISDIQTNEWIDRALQEVGKIAVFKYTYQRFNTLLPFLQHPAYLEYLQHDSTETTDYLLVATTLGIQIDRHLQRLQLSDMAYATVFDAAANVFLEHKANEFEADLPLQPLDYRFCPGYRGTSFTDNRLIAAELHAERIGITFLDSGLMVPLKSMVGIVRVGTRQRKCCDGCAALKSCGFRKRGMRCYGKQSNRQ